MKVVIKNPSNISEWRALQVKFRFETVIYLSNEPSAAHILVLTDTPSEDAPASNGYRNGDIDNPERAEMHVQYYKAKHEMLTRPNWLYRGAFVRPDHSYAYEWVNKATGKPILVDYKRSMELTKGNPNYVDAKFCAPDTPFDSAKCEDLSYLPVYEYQNELMATDKLRR